MDMDDADAHSRYVPDKDYRGDNWGRWRSTTENEVSDHETVENLLRSSVENPVSSNSMGERNVQTEHSEGNVSDSDEDDDDMYVRSVDKGKQKMV